MSCCGIWKIYNYEKFISFIDLHMFCNRNILIIGIGVDIVEIGRIKKAMERNPNFIEKVFDEQEIVYIREKNYRPEFAAVRFAAKEAVAKALGTGFRQFGVKDIIVHKDELGKPIVELKGKAREIAESKGQYKMHLSMSHGIDNAIAYAILEVD